MRSASETERLIAEHIRDFELLPLLQLLGTLGWQPHELRFASHLSSASPVSLLEAIEFVRAPTRSVLLTLNIGLLSAQTPLPSYFMKKLDSGDLDVPGFVAFVGYFDHLALRDYLGYVFPELPWRPAGSAGTNKQLFADWERTKRRYLHFMNLRSPTTLHWLLQSVFPELRVRVEKAMIGRGVRTTPLKLGETRLGSDAVFGKRSVVQVCGRRVTLYSDGEASDRGTPWAAEIQQRLKRLVFPALGAVGLDLEILLVVRSQTTWATLKRESFLGYDRMQGGANAARQIRIFAGRVLDSSTATGA